MEIVLLMQQKAIEKNGFLTEQNGVNLKTNHQIGNESNNYKIFQLNLYDDLWIIFLS